MFGKTSRSCPHGFTAPMGLTQHNQPARIVTGRWRPRICLRKGCGGVYPPRRWNQRYCQQEDCLREVRRWQAAKRQRDYRQSQANRRRHAEAEARRRRQKRAALSANGGVVCVPESAEPAADRCAWSRSKTIPADFCHRPGCYEPLPEGTRAPARYCDGDCRRAVRRVVDRERKWLTRNSYDAGAARCPESQTPARPAAVGYLDATSGIDQACAKLVGDYRPDRRSSLSCRALDRFPTSDHAGGSPRDDHCQTHSDCRSRPPPT
jgi:hypothetical protein